MKPLFKAGHNIAIKTPEHEFEQTLVFYRDILRLRPLDNNQTAAGDSVCFDFAGKTLWIDRSSTISQAEVWLEIVTDDIKGAESHLARHGCIRRDEIETLPDGFRGFWVSSPANIIHLIDEQETG